MTWQIAAGIVIGGGALIVMSFGITLTLADDRHGDAAAIGGLAILMGIGACAFIIAKAFGYI